MEKKPWNLLILVVLALTGYAFSAAQKAEPIRNPAEPHFGEIVMVLEEDLVLGNESFIKNGFLYHTTFLEETGETRVVRYRIKNWNRMRSSLN